MHGHGVVSCISMAVTNTSHWDQNIPQPYNQHLLRSATANEMTFLDVSDSSEHSIFDKDSLKKKTNIELRKLTL